MQYEFLSERQSEVLDAIMGYIEETGICPSLDDLANRLGVKYRSSVVDHIEYLERFGYLIPSNQHNVARKLIINFHRTRYCPYCKTDMRGLPVLADGGND